MGANAVHLLMFKVKFCHRLPLQGVFRDAVGRHQTISKIDVCITCCLLNCVLTLAQILLLKHFLFGKE